MSSADPIQKNKSELKTRQPQIILIAQIVLLVVCLIIGTSVFAVMALHAEDILSKSLQLSLQHRTQLIQTEIGASVDKVMIVATNPLLIDQVEQVNSGINEDAVRLTLHSVVQTFLPIGLKAIAVLDKNGRELTRTGVIAQKPVLTVPLNLPGHVQLMWDGQLLLHAVTDLKREGRVVGQVMTAVSLPVTTSSFKDASRLGATGESALCAAFGLDMQCFPTTLSTKVNTLSKRSPKGVPLPMSYALEGQTGVITTRDYRDQEVVAAYSPVGDLGLGMVLKMDGKELYVSVWRQFSYLTPLLLGLLLISLVSMRWLLSPMVFRLVHSEAQARELSASLRDSENMSGSITEAIAEGVITTTTEGIVLEANKAAQQLFGYERSELIGRDVSELVPERHRRQYTDTTAALAAQPEAFNIKSREIRSLRKDRSEFTASISYADVQVAGRRLFTALIHDISERKRSAEALRASEMQLRQITDTVPALIAELDLEQRFRFHNKAYEEIFGLSFEQINNHTLAEVLGQPAYEHAQDKVEEVLRGYPVRYERLHTTPQGDLRSYAMNYFPRYGEGTDELKIIGFFSLGTDITELKRIDRMKTEFVSTVSHELRTPLTSIRGSLGLIAGGVVGEMPEAMKNLVGIAKNNCERLIRLVNDILDSEKIESGKMQLNLQVVDIKPLVQQVIAANDGFAVQHRVTVLLQAPGEPLLVRIDSDRLAQVLTNMLSNAVKFSSPDSTVEVRVSRVARCVRVEVADHGPGIPEEFRGRIFQKFSQADSSDSRQKGGTGLGLNISKALVEQMNGAIGFNSQVGTGTTFFFELTEWNEPVILPPPLSVQVASSKPRILNVLHVEDDRDIQHIVAAIAEDVAHFEFAATLDQAQAQLREHHFDLVLLDLALDQESGWELFTVIDALNPRPRVIVFSAIEELPDDEKQIDAVLVKSHTPNDVLLDTIKRALQIPGDPASTLPQPLD